MSKLGEAEQMFGSSMLEAGGISMLAETKYNADGVTREFIIAAYKALLGRLPESDDVIQAKLDHFADPEALMAAVVASPEFSAKHGNFMHAIHSGYLRPPHRVDVDVSEEQFGKIFTRIRSQWTALGETEPYWSVMSNDRYRMADISQTKHEFYATGQESAGLIDLFCRRNELAAPRGVCLELGCGVGRITRFLAQRFEHIIAVDISEGNLALCRDHLAREGVTNVEFVLLRDLDQIRALKFDFFYSLIVLQHNPPPMIAAILRTIFSSIRSPGSFLFQVPTGIPGYHFNAEDYLTSAAPPTFEIHGLPMHHVLRILKESNANLMEVASDVFVGCYGSNTFFGTI